jgi:hypothetical protein
VKKYPLLSLLVVTLLFLIITTYSFASSISAKFSYSESWAEKLVKYVDAGDVWYDVVESGNFHINVTIPATAISVDQIDADTEIYVEIGDFASTFRVGDDPRYKPGQSTSSKIVLQDYDDNDKLFTYLIASFKWSATKLTIAINSPNSPDLSPPLAYDYAVDYGGTAGAIQESRDALVTINIKGNEVDQPFSVALTGTSKIKTVMKQGEQFDLCSVTLKGI